MVVVGATRGELGESRRAHDIDGDLLVQEVPLGYGAGAERAGADAAETYKGVRADKLRGDVESFFVRR